MKNILRYFFKLYKKFDISPISPGGFSKELIIIFWGLNAVLFLANGLAKRDSIFSKNGISINCTIIKKVSSKDFYSEHTEIIKDRGFILISSYDFALPEFDVTKITRDRSPPQEI